MKILTKLGFTFLMAVFATGILWAQQSDMEIATEAKTTNKVFTETVIGGPDIDAEVIAVGTPMSMEQVKSFNIPTQTTPSKETDEIDIIGGTSQNWCSGPRTRGNAFHCTEDKILVEFMGWHDVTVEGTTMLMLIYESDEPTGTYSLVSNTDISPVPAGLGWVSSGVINFPLETGKYYMLVASFQEACGYFLQNNITPYPYPVAFGEAIGAVGFGWTPQTHFPPDATLNPSDDAWDSPALYHQKLITENPITDDNDLGISSILSPISGTDLSANEAITVNIKNYGFNSQSGFEVSYTLDGGTAIVETVSETIASGENLEYTFATTADLSAEGLYEIEACAYLTGDENPENDCIIQTIEHIADSYCDASTTTEEEYIVNVLCGTIDNSSEWQNGVADYTDYSCTIGAGTFEEITVTNGVPNPYDNVYVWVDWNNDFEYEIGGDEEFVLAGNAQGAQFTGSVVVPENAPLGDHRMRIRMAYNSIPEPCGNAIYGEVEDYTVNVVEAAFGILNGVVTAEGGNAISGATISVAGETTTSASDGSYSFTDIFTGTQSVICDAAGYTSEIETVVIEEGQTATVNFELVLAELGNLEGIVTADGGAAIEGATISVAGITTTSGADGSYAISDILIGSYTASCSAPGYDTGSETVFIEDGQTTNLDFELNFAAPVRFTAEVFDGNDVRLNWGAPGALGYLQRDAGVNIGNGIGLGNGGTFRVASRWTPSDLEPYAGKTMTSITFYCNDDANATFVLKAWVGDNAAMEILSQEVSSYENNAFNEIVLDNPIQIDDSRELWFGYEILHIGGTRPAGVDEGPANQGYGDMISVDGTTWVSMASSWSLDYNWNLAGYIVESDNDGKSIHTPMVRTPISNPASGDQLVASGPSGTMAVMDRNDEKSLLGYNLYRDGVTLAEEIQETSYQDMDLVARMYTYDVKAVYDEGLSMGAGPADVTILGGVDRNLVIVEVGTATWCQYCPGAAMGVDEMHEEGLSVGVIEYHTTDDYSTSETEARLNYYNVSGYPTAVFDGVNVSSGGNATQSLYSSYLPEYESRIAIPSLFEIESSYYNTDGNNYQVSVNAEMIEAYPLLGNDLVLQVILTESNIPENWQNQTELNFVCRDMIPNENGTSLDFEGNTSQSVLLDFEIPSTYEMENIELIVYIQDNTTKEILQGVTSQLTTGIDDRTDVNKIDIFPNPAADYVNISANENILSITVYNNVGQTVFHQNTASKFFKINTNNFNNGLYFIQLETESGIASRRFIIE